jgi:hypothetical protein
LYYDFCNNGNCNALEYEREECEECEGVGYETCITCDDDGYYYDDEGDRVDCDDCEDRNDCGYCGGECYVDGDIYITSYFKEMMDFLQKYISLEENGYEEWI